jgi:hypothetical protein
VQPVRYVIASKENLAAAPIEPGPASPKGDDQSYSAVRARLQAYVLRHPDEAGDYQVVPLYEIEDPVTP